MLSSSHGNCERRRSDLRGSTQLQELQWRESHLRQWVDRSTQPTAEQTRLFVFNEGRAASGCRLGLNDPHTAVWGIGALLCLLAPVLLAHLDQPVTRVIGRPSALAPT